MKVFLIGLDGATWKLLKPWISEGELPTLEKIMKEGCHGVLKSTIPTQSFPAIPSLVTGKNPAKIGIFDFTARDGSLLTLKDVEEPTIWEILNMYGYKTCVVNVTGTYPPKKIHGVLVTGILTPSPNSEFTYPREIKEKIRDFHPEKWPSELGLTKPGREKELLDYVLNIAKRKYKGLRTILKDDSFDFILYWIYETDEIQHYLWHRKDLILKFYKWVDKILGELLEDFADYNFFIVSDHGFSSSPEYKFYVNTWLMKEGYLRVRNEIVRYLWSKIQSFAISHVPTKLIKKLAWTVSREKGDKLGFSDFTKFRIDIDLKRTKAIQELNGIKIVDAQNRDILIEEIINKLENLYFNDEKVIKEIWRREEIYKGKYIKSAPDIVFLLNDKFIANSTLKNIVFEKNESSMSGDHHYARDGIFIAFGPKIKEGCRINAEIFDITPTILWMFNIPIPSDMDGKVLDIFRDFIHCKRVKLDEKVKVKEKIKKLKELGRV